MIARVVLPLAYVSVLTGCVTAPKGAVVAYRDGDAPATKPIKYEAIYALCDKGAAPDAPPLTSHYLTKGEKVGFCRGADGAVHAVAPGYLAALPPGEYAWEVVPGSGPSKKERAWTQAREGSLAAGKVILIAGGIALLAVVVAGVLLIIAFAADSHGPNFT
jgi:hypothetical protein